MPRDWRRPARTPVRSASWSVPRTGSSDPPRRWKSRPVLPPAEDSTAGHPETSGQGLLRVSETPADLLDRAAVATVLVLDVGADRPSLTLEQLQHLANRRVARPPDNCLAAPAPVRQAHARDLGVMLADVRHGIDVVGGELADVRLHPEER